MSSGFQYQSNTCSESPPVWKDFFVFSRKGEDRGGCPVGVCPLQVPLSVKQRHPWRKIIRFHFHFSWHWGWPTKTDHLFFFPAMETISSGRSPSKLFPFIFPCKQIPDQGQPLYYNHSCLVIRLVLKHRLHCKRSTMQCYTCTEWHTMSSVAMAGL